MPVFKLDPEVYKRYKDEVLKLCNSFQKIDQPGLSDKQIAERLGLDERTVTEIRCVAERDCYSLDEWEKAIEFKRKATPRVVGARPQAARSQAGVTLYFFERISDDDFIGPVIVAAPDEATAWTALASRERSEVEALKTLGWQIAQDLAAMPTRPGIVYPSHYRRAILS